MTSFKNYRAIVAMLIAFLFVGCAEPPSPLKDMGLSRIGVLSELPDDATDLYMGVTVFENKKNDVSMSWNFSNALISEFVRQGPSKGVSFVDLNSSPEIQKWNEPWFGVGYSLKFGLSAHKLTENASVLLNKISQDNRLDAIVILRKSAINTDIKYPNAHPVGTFGVFKRGGFNRPDRAYTFVQFEARVIAGKPFKVTEDVIGSNLVNITDANSPLDLSSELFKFKVLEQIESAVAQVLEKMI